MEFLSPQGLWWFTVFTVCFCQVRNGERLKPTDSTCCRPLYDGKNNEGPGVTRALHMKITNFS